MTLARPLPDSHPDAEPIVVVRREAPPLTISQRTVERWTGVDGRRFLESLGDYSAAGGTVARVGKLRLVELDGWLRWLARREQATTEQPADAVASRCGLRAIGGGR